MSIKARRLLALFDNPNDKRLWLQALMEEPPVSGKPIPCGECPLRPDGEWEGGLREVIQGAPGIARGLHKWGCHHNEGRPCAGARRLAVEVTR